MYYLYGGEFYYIIRKLSTGIQRGKYGAQCNTQCCGSGSARIQNFLSDSDPKCTVIDPDPDPDWTSTLTKSSTI
jgi:hypothetical protein